MTQEERKKALDTFKDFKATLIQDDEAFFVMNWRNKNGSGNLSARYIVDKKNGTFIVTGDSGYCVADWYHPVKVEDLVDYLDSTFYFTEKMKCSTHRYTYEWENIKADVEADRQYALTLFREGHLAKKVMDEEEINEDFDNILEALEGQIENRASYWGTYDELMGEYDPDWWEDGFRGERTDPRIFEWIVGFQEGVRQIKE